MQNPSNNFVSKMGSRPYIPKITLDGSQTIQGEPIQGINFRGGANGDSDSVTIGSSVACSVEITLDAEQITASFEQKRMTVELGQNVNGTVEWLKMGCYTVTDIKEDDGTITVTGMDDIAARMDVEYQDIAGFDFESGEAIGSLDLAEAICNRHGLTIDLAGLRDYDVSGFIPYGCTDRQILGMIAGLYGKFAMIDRTGKVRFRWYEHCGVEITGDDYYEDGLEKAGFEFSVSWLKCYCEILEETLIRGNPEGIQGIYFACPWMTDEILDGIWSSLQSFKYTPVVGLSFLGDPRLDLGDMITLKNLAGETFRVPVVTISHEFDGGLRTEISAQGKASAETHEGPVQREVKRAQAKIVKTLKGIEMEVKDAGDKIANLQLTADGLAGRVEDVERAAGEFQDTVTKKFMDLEATAEGLSTTVGKQTDDINGIKSEMTNIQQRSDEISLSVQKIVDNGVDKVVTSTGYTFKEDGLRIAKSGEEMVNRLDNTGMYVERSGETILQANNEGVVATDVTVRNYLIVGEHARFEDYSNGTDSARTACFWI